MAKPIQSLDVLRKKVFLTLFLCLCSVALVLASATTFLSLLGYHERARMSLVTYSRLNLNALFGDDDEEIPSGLTFLSEGDFATIGVSDKGKVTSIEYSGESFFLTTATAQAIVDTQKREGKYQKYLFLGNRGPWGGFYMVMDLAIVFEAAIQLLVRTLIALVAIFLLFFLLARKIANVLIRPAEETFKRQQQFTADCSHELKTPLASIRANAELVEAKHGACKELEYIQSETETMGNLIEELLTLAKLDEVDQRASFTSLDFSRMCMNVSMLMEALMEEKEQKLEKNIEAHVVVKGSKRNLQKLISTLLENAASHAPEKSTITLSLTHAKGEAILAITNPSEEIPQEQLPRLFDRFYQQDPEGGSRSNFGLGLAIAKSITETHGGAISASWNEGKLTFSAKIPLQD